jgi:hypothetical protein
MRRKQVRFTLHIEPLNYSDKDDLFYPIPPSPNLLQGVTAFEAIKLPPYPNLYRPVTGVTGCNDL